jgi:hypothetical protein
MMKVLETYYWREVVCPGKINRDAWQLAFQYRININLQYMYYIAKMQHALHEVQYIYE